MGILEKFFGGKDKPAPQPSGICRVIAAYLDCPCEYLPEGTEYGEAAEILDAAVAEGKEQGYYPVLIVTNEGNLAQSFYDNAGISDILEGNVNYERGAITVKENFSLDDETLQKLHDYRTKLIAEWQESDAGDYNLKTLANGLTQSPYWYFWWD